RAPPAAPRPGRGSWRRPPPGTRRPGWRTGSCAGAARPRRGRARSPRAPAPPPPAPRPAPPPPPPPAPRGRRLELQVGPGLLDGLGQQVGGGLVGPRREAGRDPPGRPPGELGRPAPPRP